MDFVIFMLFKRFVYIFLFVFTAPLHAEVYKCDDGGTISFSTKPCVNLQIDLELDIESGLVPQEERFFLPTYPGWPSGWKIAKDLKLERFIEIEYEPNNKDEASKLACINQQQLTDLPKSMSAQQFALSVEDIIESICENAMIYKSNNLSATDNVFYGHYACSYKRNTKQGELGYYKIIRGAKSIYMTTIKWGVTPFNITEGKPLDIIKDKTQTQKINIAKKYLRKDVKLCKGETCL